ncbi:MAG: M14 family metallopeptidase [Bacteroidota bacterium]
MKKLYISFILFFSVQLIVVGQTTEQMFQAVGTPMNPKVEIIWNRYYTSEGLETLAKKMAEAHPNLVKLISIGKSYEGRDLWCIAITDYNSGKEMEKPAFYIDGNIHSNETQCSEMALYTAWYLAESFDNNKFINQLLKDRVFYILPTINPDARNAYMKDPNTASTPRSGMMPIDDDRDGLVDEDGFEDLNGDGEVTLMRRKSKFGRLKAHPSDPNRMESAEVDEFGEYEYLGYEGIDNDGDGRINEDRVGGYYDPNRNWAWGWMPEYTQRGAHRYPFSVPENRAVQEFVMAHPNIAGAQSYHNTGGMLLRGPGTEMDRGSYTREDIRVYDALGEMGAKLIPGYRYLIVYKDLYSAYGGELDWLHGGRGIFTFTNELYTSYLMFNKSRPDADERALFSERLLFQDDFIEWTPFNHPTYGEIEIGGTRKNSGRNHTESPTQAPLIRASLMLIRFVVLLGKT